MANKKKEVYKVGTMTEGQRNLIAVLLSEYDIQTADDIQDALKDLLGDTIQEMREAEMDEHLGYDKYERSSESNYRNGTKSKRVLKQLDAVTKKWKVHYPNAMKRWSDNWDVITPIFKFSSEVRKVIYTTNSIESLNSSYRRLNRQRSVFPSSQALLNTLADFLNN